MMKGFTLAYRLMVGSWLSLPVTRLVMDLLSGLLELAESLAWLRRLRSAGRSLEELSEESELVLLQLRESGDDGVLLGSWETSPIGCWQVASEASELVLPWPRGECINRVDTTISVI